MILFSVVAIKLMMNIGNRLVGMAGIERVEDDIAGIKHECFGRLRERREEIEIERETDRQTHRHRETQTERDTDRQIERQRGRQRDRERQIKRDREHC